VRLFVAVRPPAAVAALATNAHVTLRFLGDVDDELVPEVADALRTGLVDVPAAEAEVGTRVQRLGMAAIVVPVAGLEEVAAAVATAVGRYGGEDRPFRGHLTLARIRRGRPAPVVAGPPAPVRWRVTEVELLRSDLGKGDGGTARHTVVATVPLAGPG
jgi:2'-5' RNA ligase